MVDADYTGQLGGEGRRNTRIPQLHYLKEKGLQNLQWQAFIITVIISVADPDPRSGAFWTPASGIGDGIRAGMNIPDHISERLETIFWVKNS